jgi:ribosomal-protein-alanine N-acetyltransferase
MCPIEIRAFERRDFVRLHAIDELCFPAGIAYSKKELLSCILHPDSITRVAVLDNAIVGFAVGQTQSPEVGHVLTIDVVAEARRHKVGSLLMHALHEEFRQRRLRAVILEVSTENAGALKFYEIFKYRRLGRIHSYYANGQDAYQMMCLLDACR